VPFIEGLDRNQETFLPARLDDFVEPHAFVRVIDAFVGRCDLKTLGFTRASELRTGRPGYAAGPLLKLYIWGYMNRCRSSRELEAAAKQNVVVMWLAQQLAPDHKTISEFRRLNAGPIGKVTAAFIEFCRGKDLIGKPDAARLGCEPMVAIDGSKIAAAASRRQALYRSRLQKRLAAVEAEIGEWLGRLDAAEAAEPPAEGGDDAARVAAALAALADRREQIEADLLALAEAGAKTLVRGESEAAVVAFANGTTGPGYNLQAATDTQSGLIVHYDLLAEATDRGQLATMAEGAKAALCAERLSVIADAGYSNGAEAAACEAAEIEVTAPAQRTVNPHGLFERTRFAYEAESDSFICPAGARLARRSRQPDKDGCLVYAADKKDCAGCALKAQCTTGARRTVSRHIHDGALERMSRRAKDHPERRRLRLATSERPFALIKRALGARFLLRGRLKAKAEAALAVLAYNLKQAARLLTTESLLAALA
jgi:transposase